MKAIMTKELGLKGDKSPFASIQRAIKDTFEADTQESCKTLVDAVSEVFDRVAENFALMLQDERFDPVESPHHSELRERFEKWAIWATKEIEKAIEEFLEAEAICYYS